ncbi:6,7-dimethyl-8-ribityllumazine synthase [Brachybacterium vulturis]|uniref:6,7-dimethyl-8-ribityllumazine synthase n=1 Tax=Brachybacterium vulturis TaxID=2017484 RepID=UPI003735A007
MSGHGSPTAPIPHSSDTRLAIVAATWHQEVMDGLLAGALRGAAEAGIAEPTVVRAPGSFELPVLADALARDHNAVVALGVVIRGGTPHFEYVCAAATDGLTRVGLDHGVPVGFGLLTCDDEKQALDRAGLPGSVEDKGYEAASAALTTAHVLAGLAARREGGA